MRLRHHHQAMNETRSTLLLIGLLFLLFLLSPATGAPVKKIVVADFTLERGVETVFTSDQPAEWLTQDLTGWRNVEIIPRDQLLKEVTVRNLTLPLDADDLLKIARSLEADYYAAGQVNHVRVWAKGQKARVGVTVEMVDVVTETPAFGAVVEVVVDTANDPSVIPAMDALRYAVQNAAREIQQCPSPTGKILAINSFNEIIINIGSQNGVKKGMRFVVTRRDFDKETQTTTTRKVGEIRVSDVDHTEATATQTAIFEAVRPLDRIQAIFDPRTAKRKVFKR